MEDLSYFCGAVDPDLYISFSDRACKKFLGDRYGGRFIDIMMEFDGEMFSEACERVLMSGFEEDMLISLERPDGVFSPFHLNLSLSEDSGDRSVMFKASDIYLSEEHFRDLKNRMSEIEDFISNMGFYLFKYDKSTKNIRFISFENNEEKILFDDQMEVWVETQLAECVPEEDKAKVVSFQTILESTAENVSVTFHTSFFDDESKKFMQFAGTSVIGSGGEKYIDGYVMNVRDDMKGPVLSDTSKDKDSATGVYDKDAIKAYSEKALAEMSDERMVWLAIFDIDEFNELNNTYGHSFGDEAIRALARCISQSVGSNGAVGRFGGDQFFMCLSGADENDIRGLFTEVRKNFEWEVGNIEPDCHPTLTIGTVSAPLNGRDYDTLFEKLWKALYIGKGKGRNRYIIYREEMHGNYELPNKETVGKYMKGYTQLLAVMIADVAESIFNNGKEAVKPALKEVSDVMLLDAVRIFSGPELSCIYSTSYDGKDEIEQKVVDAILQSRSFDHNGILTIHMIELTQDTDPVIYEWATERRVGSVIFFVEKDNEGKVERLISFEHGAKSVNRKWADEDPNYLLVFSKLLSAAITKCYEAGEML